MYDFRVMETDASYCTNGMQRETRRADGIGMREDEGGCVVPASTSAPYKLSLDAEHGMFVLLRNAILEDDHAIVDILSMHGLDFDFVSVPGDAYTRRAVTRDFAVVRRVFR